MISNTRSSSTQRHGLDPHALVEQRRQQYEAYGEDPIPVELHPRLADLRNRYKGHRIFIIGNGPSLNNTDLACLANEYTFAVNKFYLLFDQLKWVPTFYTSLDWRVVPDIYTEINGLTGSIKFNDYRYWDLLTDETDVIWYSHSGIAVPEHRANGFSTNAADGLVGAGSVVGSAIQLAYHMGFDPIYLIGCDLGYKVPSSVLQEGPDAFGNGVGLYLTSTADDDPNHFAANYFGKGSKWHDPNVKRMIQGHEACRKTIETSGRRIFNATVGGELEVYPRVSFDDLFRSQRLSLSRSESTSPPLIGPFSRDQRMTIDENQVVRRLCEDLDFEMRPLMIDVGAHFGTASIPFFEEGWDVHAFEPDPENRKRLASAASRLRPRPRSNPSTSQLFEINEEAVSDVSKRTLPMYRSPTSSGVSALDRFMTDHEQFGVVKTIRLDDYLADADVGHCTYLKIDVEGHDLYALRSFPFDKMRPTFVLVEFDNAKTLPKGYSVGTVADELARFDYRILVSEWFPITQYGAQHDWLGLFLWGTRAPNPKGWGNLLAIEESAWQAVQPHIATAVSGALTDGARRLERRDAKRPTSLTSRSASSRDPRGKPAHRLVGRFSHLAIARCLPVLRRWPSAAKSLHRLIRRIPLARSALRALYRRSPADSKAMIDRLVTDVLLTTDRAATKPDVTR